MEIKNLRVYGLESSIWRSGFPMLTGDIEEVNFNDVNNLKKDNLSVKSYTRADKLASAPVGSGHDNWLKGVIVQFDLKYTQYWTKHLQRYTWFTYFSGQSLMHKLTSVENVKDNCNKWTLDSSVDLLNKLIYIYNDESTVYPFFLQNVLVQNKEDLFHVIISNCPMGYELWQPISTNYMSLKTMYHQRKTHKLYDWKKFCEWVETLPMSHLITGKEK